MITQFTYHLIPSHQSRYTSPKHQSTIATPSLAAKAKRHQNDVQAQTALKGIESGKSIIQKLFQTEWVRLAGICVIIMSLSFLQTKTKTY